MKTNTIKLIDYEYSGKYYRLDITGTYNRAYMLPHYKGIAEDGSIMFFRPKKGGGYYASK